MTSTTPDRLPAVSLGHASEPGLTVPQLGFGVWEVAEAEVETALALAFEVGHRHVDTARIYGNERGVGRVLADTDVPRDDLFVTTKLWNDDHANARQAFESSTLRLGIDVLDLYLIHWPAPGRDTFVEAWTTMLELQREGRVRSVGVCNFQPVHLQRLLDETGVLPAINQIELSPYLQQRELRAFHAEHDIVTEAWSPLAVRAGLLDDPVVTQIAASHGVSPAQLVLRWHLELGNVVLTRSVTPSRIRDNIDIFGFQLTAGDHDQLGTLDRGQRTGPDPDRFGS